MRIFHPLIVTIYCLSTSITLDSKNADIIYIYMIESDVLVYTLVAVFVC